MKEKIKEITEKSEEQVIKTIGELVKIPSVRNEEDKAPGAPFGKETRKALNYVIELGKSFGMRTHIGEDGSYGYIEIGDESLKEMVGVIGHLDVVPPGDATQWEQNEPFLGEVVDGKILGRGSLDDKGPVVMCLYSMKNLLDLGVELNKRVRLILGTSEETSWEGIDSYVAHEESPTIGFSPDAEFPLINAEKTIAQFDGNTTEDVDFEIKALGAYNATPDRATYKGNKKEELKVELDKLNYKYKEEDDLLVVVGKSSHGMNPQLGINAIVHLCVALYNIGEHSNVVDFVANKINGTYNGEKILGETIEDFSGKLTLNLSRIEIKDGKGYLGFDSRIPVLADVDDIIEKYTNALEEFGIVYSDAKIQDKLYVKEDSPLVTTLMNIYKDETGEKDAKPLAIGGGTYARAFDNCVAFGSVFISQNQIDRMHQPNECLEVKFIKPALNIYTRAIYELSK